MGNRQGYQIETGERSADTEPSSCRKALTALAAGSIAFADCGDQGDSDGGGSGDGERPTEARTDTITSNADTPIQVETRPATASAVEIGGTPQNKWTQETPARRWGRLAPRTRRTKSGGSRCHCWGTVVRVPRSEGRVT